MNTKEEYGKSLVSSLDSEFMSWGGQELPILACPECGDPFSHPSAPLVSESHDDYTADWPGRGELIIIPIEGECGCEWQVCFGYHKGNVVAFTRAIKSCEDGV